MTTNLYKVLATKAGAIAVLLSTTLGAMAYDINSTSAVNVDANGVILRSVDATSYLADGTPKAGSADFSAESGGATYLFASAEARDAFLAAPETYEPAFGGFCATGAALGKKLDGDPAIFRIFEGKLYLFVSDEAAALWDKDPAGTLANANANRPNISDKTPASLE